MVREELRERFAMEKLSGEEGGPSVESNLKLASHALHTNFSVIITYTEVYNAFFFRSIRAITA